MTSPRHSRYAAGVAALVATATMASAPAAAADDLGDGAWWRSAMGVSDLAAAGGTGKGITVAVIDTPLDASAPELAGKVRKTSTQCVAARGTKRSSTSKGSEAEHATQVASLIAGSGKGTVGGKGILGIAPEATLLHYAVLYPDPAGSKDVFCGLEVPNVNDTPAAVVAAIRQAVADGAKVINLSITTEFTPEYAGALLDAYRAGAIVVGATRNEEKDVRWPAIGNGVVTVTHIDRAGKFDTTSTRHDALVDFAAPGVAVGTGKIVNGAWNSAGQASGSSYATALTSGGLAALWSAHPTATANQILQVAKDNVGMTVKDGKAYTSYRRVGTNLPKATGKTESYGWGIFDPADAVRIDPKSAPDVNPMVEDSSAALPTEAEIRAVEAAGSSSSPGTPPSASTPSAPASPTTAATRSPTTTPGAEPTTAATAPGAKAEGSRTGLLVALAALVVLGLVGAIVAATRSRRGTAPASNPPHPTNARNDQGEH
jgi:subtilisin family serine protease